MQLQVNKAALMQIIMNLVSNGIKYNSKKDRTIHVNLDEDQYNYLFEIIDNGDGIPAKSFDKIFELFSIGNKVDRNGKAGTGIGLATVKKLIKKLGGGITVESSIEEGSIFRFSLPKP